MNIDVQEYVERLDECVYLSKVRPTQIETILVVLIPDMERKIDPYATLLVKSLLGSYLEVLEELGYLKETLKELSK